MERRRAGDSAAKVFIDDKPFTPSSHELWKVGAEKDEIRRWIGEGNKMAMKNCGKTCSTTAVATLNGREGREQEYCEEQVT